MNRQPDAWSALRDRPWRFLRSAWPWRSLLYLLTTVPIGIGAAAVLFVVLGIGLLTLVVVVGLVVLASIPAITGAVAEVERRRVGLVTAGGGTGGRPTQRLRDRVRAARELPVAWAEVGYAFLLATLLWVVDGVVLSTIITAPLAFLASPVIVQFDRVDILAWQVDHTGEALLLAAGPGVVLTVVAAYVVTGLAAAQAGLARALLDPNDARLEAAVRELRRSRVDLVDAFETERRRIERDLHDGVQQRLVALTLTLGRAEYELPDGPARTLVRDAQSQAETALEELRSTVRGIHPRVLVDHGLAAAIHEIADRSAVPVRVDLAVPALPSAIEAAAYFVVSEALTNVARHAGATAAQVTGWVEAERFVLVVVDDGVGGAVPSPGSGLSGLALRLEALDGTLTVTSPPGGPTEVRMTCPIDAG